jgi:hypothetical protein
MLASSELRRRWRSVVALTFLVAVVGALVLATAAGARRTDSALTRFNLATRSDDVQVVGPFAYSPTPAELHALRTAPGVSAVAIARFYALVPVHLPADVGIAAAVDTKLGTVVDRGRLLAGRRANPAAADEITIGEARARQLHQGVGGHLDVLSYSVSQLEQAAQTNVFPPPSADGPRIRLRIVGIYGPGDLGLAGQVIVLTPAFDRAYLDRIGNFGVIMPVRTIHGASDVPNVVREAQRIFRAAGGVSLQSAGAGNLGAQNAINVLTLALWIFAGVAALAGIVTVGIVLTRDMSRVRVEQTTLRALGLTRRERVLINGPRTLLIAGGGGLLAAVGAVAASGLFPVGLARRADPDVGVHIDWVVLMLGVVAVAVVVVAIALVAALRGTRRSALEAATDRGRTSRVADAAARSGMGPSAMNGLRMALDPGRGDNAVPIRSAYLGAVFGVLGITAVLVFTSSLDHLVATPRLYGLTWDFHAVDTGFNSDVRGCNHNDFGLTHTRGVAAVAAVCTDDIQLGGRAVSGWGFTAIRGTIKPEVVAGRAPRTSGEVALGAKTLQASGTRIGDTVKGRGPAGAVRYKIVGRVVFAALGDRPVNSQPLADGAAFTGAGLARIFDSNSTSNRYLLGRYAPGADRAATTRRVAAISGLDKPAGSPVPVEVDRLRHIGWFPVTLAALLGSLALLSVGHALVTAVRRRRRELAVLKTLGFSRRQVRATIAWQATTLASVGLVIGIPVGLISGGLIWRLVAEGLGVSTATTIPTVAVIVTIPVALVLVNVTAFLPARAAARTRPAVALRSE